MDKKTIIGLVLIGLVLLGYTMYNSRQADIYAGQKRMADSIARAEGRLVDEPAAVIPAAPDTLSQAGEGGAASLAAADSARRVMLGDALADARNGEERSCTIENDVMRITFSNRGAKVAGVELKNYKTYYKEPLQVMAPGSSRFDMMFFLRNMYNDVRVNTGDYYFETGAVESVTLGDGRAARRLTMALPVDSAARVEFVYTVPQDDYMIDFDVRFVGMENMLSQQQSTLWFDWAGTGPRQEKGFENENKYSTVTWRLPGENGVSDLGISETGKQTSVTTNVQWIAFKQQFFTSIFQAKGNFLNADMSYNTLPNGDENLKEYGAQARVAWNRNVPEYGFRFYFGPIDYYRLQAYGDEMDRLVSLGWSLVRWVNQGLVIPVFDFLTRHLGSYGLIIFLLTLMIKIIILPLTYKSYLSMGKMRVLKPEIDEIAKKFPDKADAMKKQQATMELYKKAGVSPMGGCLPMLIQFPIIIALFFFFPTAIQLRGKSFLWAEDLSTYDSVASLPFDVPWYGDHISLFALLMAVSVFLSTKFNPQTAQSSQMGGMKMLTYLMPVMLLLWFNNYASGLTYYYLISNVITLAQTWGFRYVVNDEKLRGRMKAKASASVGKKKTKSKWQQRYEQMVRDQQKQLDQKKKGR